MIISGDIGIPTEMEVNIYKLDEQPDLFNKLLDLLRETSFVRQVNLSDV